MLGGKVALITGAARGQGRSHALALAEAGADLGLCDSAASIPTVPYELATEDELETTAADVESLGARCLTRRVDVRDLDALTRFAEDVVGEHGRLDAVVANAGIYSYGPNTWELSPEQWSVMLDVNLTGVWHTCKATIPAIIATGEGGSVTLISSVNAFTGVPGCAHYTATKTALIGLMRTLAIELAPYQIRVNTLHPTGTNTKMAVNDAMTDAFAIAERAGKDMTNLLPVQLLEPSDVSDALLWLVSPSARFVTGITLPIDAGYTVK
jgi:SDR family mycofactocin-dependent oxidoreductase